MMPLLVVSGHAASVNFFVGAPSPTKQRREIAARNVAAPRDITNARSASRARLAAPLIFQFTSIVQKLVLVAFVCGNPGWIVARRCSVIRNLSQGAHIARCLTFGVLIASWRTRQTTGNRCACRLILSHTKGTNRTQIAGTTTFSIGRLTRLARMACGQTCVVGVPPMRAVDTSCGGVFSESTARAWNLSGRPRVFKASEDGLAYRLSCLILKLATRAFFTA